MNPLHRARLRLLELFHKVLLSRAEDFRCSELVEVACALAGAQLGAEPLELLAPLLEPETLALDGHGSLAALLWAFTEVQVVNKQLFSAAAESPSPPFVELNCMGKPLNSTQEGVFSGKLAGLIVLFNRVLDRNAALQRPDEGSKLWWTSNRRLGNCGQILNLAGVTHDLKGDKLVKTKPKRLLQP